MLFSRREPLSQIEPSFTQRFSSKLGQYFVPSDPHAIKYPKNKTTLNIEACYALLGEKTDNNQYKLSDLKNQLEKLTLKYQKKTGKLLELEQLAVVALKIDAQKQAEMLRNRFFDQDFSSCTLFSKTPTSPLQLALLSDALNITSFSDTTTQPPIPEFKACRHMLNVLLSDVSMQDIENSCRDLRESCAEAMIGRGIDIESLQSSWQLRMRYNNSENSLLLKCMPLDMLRDTFKRQYAEKFGQTTSKQDIIIESLEVTVHSEDETTPGAPTNSAHIENFMQPWLSKATDTNLVWSKKLHSSAPTPEANYMDCSVLHKMLASHVTEPTDSKISDFFIQKV